MRRLAAAALLALPALLAFGRGGYFPVTRVRVAILACVLLAAAAVVAKRPLPRSTAGRLALGGLAALTAWTGISIAWAPLGGPAFADLERLILYTATLAAGIALLGPSQRGAPAAGGSPGAERARDAEPVGGPGAWVEPAMLATAVAAALYGLAERLLPGLVDLQTLPSAGDRLAHPLTYWNAQGALAAIGLVVAAGIAARPGRLQAVAAATAPVLGLDLYLTLSRGAIGAGLAGLAVLVALQPTRATLKAVAVVGGAAAASALAALPLDGVQSAGGSAGQGAAMIAVLAVLAVIAALPAATRTDRRIAIARPLAVGALALLLAGTVIAAASGGQGPASSTEAERLISAQSIRSVYWRVAAELFAEHPIRGIGSGSFGVEWLQRREIAEAVRDAHLLYLETAAELGIVGLAALAALLAGVALAARRARLPATIAALAAFALHAGLDWDWEMPALSVVAILLAARVIAAQEP